MEGLKQSYLAATAGSKNTGAVLGSTNRVKAGYSSGLKPTDASRRLSDFNADFIARQKQAGSGQPMPLGPMSYGLAGHIAQAVRSGDYDGARRMVRALKAEPSLPSIFQGEDGGKAKREMVAAVHDLSQDAGFVVGAKKELLGGILQILYVGGQTDELLDIFRLFKEQPSLATPVISVLASNREMDLLRGLELDGADPMVDEYLRKVVRHIS